MASSKANLLKPGEEKYGADCKVPSVGSRHKNGQLMLKRSEPSESFPGRLFEDKARETITECVISLCTTF